MSANAKVHRRKQPPANCGLTPALQKAKKRLARRFSTLRSRVDSTSGTVRANHPTQARVRAASLDGPIRAASTASSPAVSRSNFVPNPVIVSLNERAAHPMAAPSWRSFCACLFGNPNPNGTTNRGLASATGAHQRLQLAVLGVVATLVLLLTALSAYWWLLPATADADSPYATAEATQAASTPTTKWKAGAIPSLYQNDPEWSAIPYGQATLGDVGAAPTALAMAYVAVTGDKALSPADFAAWATEHDLTASGADTIAAYLSEAAPEFGLALKPLAAEDRELRRAIVSNVPVLVITHPGTFAPTASVVVLDDIDRDSHIVLHDPASASRSAKGWKFDDITSAAAQAYEVSAA